MRSYSHQGFATKEYPHWPQDRIWNGSGARGPTFVPRAAVAAPQILHASVGEDTGGTRASGLGSRFSSSGFKQTRNPEPETRDPGLRAVKASPREQVYENLAVAAQSGS